MEDSGTINERIESSPVSKDKYAELLKLLPINDSIIVKFFAGKESYSVKRALYGKSPFFHFISINDKENALLHYNKNIPIHSVIDDLRDFISELDFKHLDRSNFFHYYASEDAQIPIEDNIPFCEVIQKQFISWNKEYFPTGDGNLAKKKSRKKGLPNCSNLKHDDLPNEIQKMNPITELQLIIHHGFQINFPPVLSKEFVVQFRNFSEELKDYASSSQSLYYFYKCLLAPYSFFKMVLNSIESHVLTRLPNFFLVQRGSIEGKVALKSACDLDLEIILPRHVLSFEKAQAFIGGSIKEEVFGERDTIKKLTYFSWWCRNLFAALTTSDEQELDIDVESELDMDALDLSGMTVDVDGLSVDIGDDVIEVNGCRQFDVNADYITPEGSVSSYARAKQKIFFMVHDITGVEISRSLNMKATVNGYDIDIDLFPRLIDIDGRIWGPSAKDSEGQRRWEEVSVPPFYRSSLPNRSPHEENATHSPQYKLNEVCQAVVLYLKLWKYISKQVTPALEEIRGYHIVLAVDVLRQKVGHKIDEKSEPLYFKKERVAALGLDV